MCTESPHVTHIHHAATFREAGEHDLGNAQFPETQEKHGGPGVEQNDSKIRKRWVSTTK